MLARILLSALLIALPGGAQATPHSISLSYNVTLNGARIAVLNERFKMLIVEHDGTRYEQIVTRLDFKP